LDPYVSRKIGVLRFVAVAWVVVFHAYPTSAAGSSAGAGAFEAVVSLGLSRWALPFLSLISGYLFFRTFRPGVAGYLTKVRSRARTIFLPFLIWSAAAVLFAAVTGDPEFGGPIDSPGEALYHWLLRPVATPLWFLQALMTCIVLSPLVYLAVRALRGWVFLFALAWWLTGVQADVLWPWVSPVAFPPFIAGAAIAVLRPAMGWAKRPAAPPVAAGLLAAWLAASTLFALYGVGLGPWMRAAMLPAVVFGIGAVWSGADALRAALRADALRRPLTAAPRPSAAPRLPAAATAPLAPAPLAAAPLAPAPRLSAAAVAVAPLAFFVYATQQPQLKAIMLALDAHAPWLPDTVAYLAAPSLAVALSIATGLVLRRAAPRAYALVSGGRLALGSSLPAGPEPARGRA